MKSTTTLNLRLACTAGALAMMTAAPAATYAQDVSAEEIIVTGSRIARDPNLSAPVPVQYITGDEISTSGEFSLVDVVNDIPALVGSTSSEQSIDSGFALGTNVLNLRGLGSNRTLVLIDGRRSVGGVEGSAAVDISSIPAAMVERVEVLTGGASAIYGADAVTGVVNFILKENFEGLEIDGFLGSNGHFDGEQVSISATGGRNFKNGRGNVTLSLTASRDKGLKYHESESLLGGPASSGGEWTNPDLRFQRGDISASATPNLARFFNFNNTGEFSYGLPIPTQEDFVTSYTSAFSSAPTLNDAEIAILARSGISFARTVIDQPVFSITSGTGYIIPGNPYNFSGFDPETPIDLDRNGTPDCLDSFVGYNSSFSASGFGVVGGCWAVNDDGSIRPIQDGLITGNFNGGGGDSVLGLSSDYVLPPEDRFSAYTTADYELTPWATLFGEASYSYQKVQENVSPTSFWDLLYGAPDNPFIPDAFQAVADANDGIAITIDPTTLGNPLDTDERHILRLVGGVKGEVGNGYKYEVAATYGQFKREAENQGRVINDRFFAAIDAVIDPATNAATCRSTLDETALPRTTPFGIPVYDGNALYSFTPGAGSSCVPLNIWAGSSGVTQEALDFIIAPDPQEDLLQQTVVSANLIGDSSDFFTLPAGPVDFAVGAEYRKEKSKVKFSDLRLGVLPEGSPNAGQNINEVSTNSSLFFRPNLGFSNTFASDANYDVKEVFAEVSVPVLQGAPFAEELRVDGAYRYSDYSTIGDTGTWKIGAEWVPVSDIRFRGTLSQAVRAPNIGELFAPDQGTTFRPSDPCSVSNIANATAVDATDGAQIQANCITELEALGVDPFDRTDPANVVYNFTDPLSAAFGGIVGGNSNLGQETADTITIGFVTRPSFLPGFTLSADYWEVKIEDGIRSINAQDIVDTCSLTNAAEFCDAYTRNADPASAQFGGLNSLTLRPINYSGFEAAGIDFDAAYSFEFKGADIGLRVGGTKNEKLVLFADINDPDAEDPELGESGRPEWILNTGVNFTYDRFNAGWSTQYLSEQTEVGVEIEDLDTLFGPIGNAGDSLRHDINLGFEINDQFNLYGGINNLTDEVPFRTSQAYPFSPRGRFVFIGAKYKL